MRWIVFLIPLLCAFNFGVSPDYLSAGALERVVVVNGGLQPLEVSLVDRSMMVAPGGVEQVRIVVPFQKELVVTAREVNSSVEARVVIPVTSFPFWMIGVGMVVLVVVCAVIAWHVSMR